jgi:small-conductance mechanosensitive channel
MDEISTVLREPLVQLMLTGAAFVAVAWLAQAVLMRVLRRVVRRPSIAADLVDAAQAPARLVLPLLALQIPLDQGVGLPGVAVAVHLVRLGLIAGFVWFALRAVRAAEAGVARHHPVDIAGNLHARRIITQTTVLARIANALLIVIGIAVALMTFPGVRSIGTSLLASAGLAGIVVGFAARPVLSNVIAGLQIALTQPIRIDDVLVVEGEWGRVEQITGAFVVLRIWDQRRLVVPLQYFVDHPVANWTLTESQLLGTVFVWADFDVDIEAVRAEVARFCRASPHWDGRSASLQVTDANERAVQLRAVVSAVDSGHLWDLRCELREALLVFLRSRDRRGLPRVRLDGDRRDAAAREDGERPIAAH